MGRFSQLVVFAFVLASHNHQSAVARRRNSRINYSPKQYWNFTYVDHLKQDLLLNYDKFARPAQHFDATTVTIGLRLWRLSIDEIRSTMSVNAWFVLKWKDEKLQWKPVNYGGVAELHLAEHEIWQPDIVLYNSASGNSATHYGGTYCVAKQQGEILWVPPVQLTALCNLDLRLWPFDTQNCSLTFGSWSYHGEAVNLTDPEPLDVWDEWNAEWEVLESSAEKGETKHACCDEPYHDVTYGMVLRRKTSTFRTILGAPIFMVVAYTLISFWLPPQSGDKLVLNGCSLLVVSVFLLYFAQKVPATGPNTPLVVLFYSYSLYWATFSTISSVLVIWLARTKHPRPLPWCVKKILAGRFRKWLFLSAYVTQDVQEEMKDHQFSEPGPHGRNSQFDSGAEYFSPQIDKQQDWVLLAVAVDRISFFAYCFTFLIVTVAFSI